MNMSSAFAIGLSGGAVSLSWSGRRQQTRSNGRAAFYFPSEGPGAGIGACGQPIADTDMVGALGWALTTSIKKAFFRPWLEQIAADRSARGHRS